MALINRDLHYITLFWQLKFWADFWELLGWKSSILSGNTAIMLLQVYMNFFLLMSTKEHILKNIGNQTVGGSHWLLYYGEKKKKLFKAENCPPN